jgi:hypothetical protein
MSDIHEMAEQKLDDLYSGTPEERREAVYFLAEAAHDEVIPQLIEMYNDKGEDPSVRKAARYALGMFKSVKIALDKKQDAKVDKLLSKIQAGEIGRRRKTPLSRLIGATVGLLVLFLVLAGANFFVASQGENFSLAALSGGDGGDDNDNSEVGSSGGGGSDSNRDRAELVSLVRSTYDGVRADGQTLQDQFNNFLGGSELNCTAFFNVPAAVELSGSEAAAHADLVTLVSAINSARDGILDAHTRYEQACFDDMPLESGEVGGVLAPIREGMTALIELEGAVVAAEAVNPADGGQPEAAATEAATAEPPIEPTVDPGVVAQHFVPLITIIDTVNNPTNGANHLLAVYWNDAALAGATSGCEEPVPAIPADYDLPPGETYPPELTNAVVQIKIGLGLLRQGWQLFETACANNTLSDNALQGADVAQTATNAFNNANTLLVELQGR